MQLHESGEMYLKTILIIQRKKGSVRSIDISEEMKFSKPSVSRAVKILKEENMIEVDSQGHITLTESGSVIANKMMDRHITIASFLRKLGIEEKIVLEDACRIEHVISDQSFAKIKEFEKKL